MPISRRVYKVLVTFEDNTSVHVFQSLPMQLIRTYHTLFPYLGGDREDLVSVLEKNGLLEVQVNFDLVVLRGNRLGCPSSTLRELIDDFMRDRTAYLELGEIQSNTSDRTYSTTISSSELSPVSPSARDPFTNI